jgi:hypothetical protein
MSEILKKESTCVVAELNGKYWGVAYDDGQIKAHDFGSIDKAILSEPDCIKNPTDFTYQGSVDWNKLINARLVKVKVTIYYEICD